MQAAMNDLLDLLNEEEEWMKPFREYHDKLVAQAQRLFPAFRPPKLHFGLRGQCAGRAWYDKNEVGLNYVYCQTQARDMLMDTLPHEIAHILAWQRYGRAEAGHGHGWSAMFGALTGRAPLGRCHNYPHIKQEEQKLSAAKGA